MTTKVRVNDLIDEAPLGRTQIVCLVLGILTLIMDGFDTYTVGYVGPVIVKEWGISPSYLGLIFSASMISGLLGSVAVAPFADRYGRHRLLIISVFVFGLSTVVSGTAPNPTVFLVCRVVTGVGLGATLPNIVVLIAEYSPRKYRWAFSVIVTAAMAVGLVLAGAVAAIVIPLLGWRALLYICGGIPIAWALLIGLAMPESIRFLVLVRPNDRSLRRLLEAIRPSALPAGDVTFYLDEEQATENPVKQIFSHGRAKLTILLWLGNSLVYGVDFLIAFWLPSLMTQLGNSLQAAAIVLMVFKSFSAAGPIFGGFLMDKWGPPRVLMVSFAGAAVGMVAFGLYVDSYSIALGIAVVAGLFEGTAFNGLIGYSASFYPTAMRATGLGWVLGAARTTASLGPIGGGLLLSTGFRPADVAFFIAIPLALNVLLIAYLQRLEPNRIGHTVSEPAAAMSPTKA
jgi:AAHS family 4-hydroxybenzoate transporter-like MFS transporter